MSGLKKLISIISAAAVSVTALTANVSALETYDPYSYDRWGDPVASQVGYTAEKYVDGEMIGCGNFYEPADLFISHDNLMYIADKGNNRIVITDLDFNFKKELKEFNYNGETLTLKKPTGVFVDQYTGLVYICDTENDRVLKSDTDGNVDRIFTKPESELYDQGLTYQPSKVLVDKAGNVYVVIKSVTKGAVMYNADGEFLGFYGANRVQQTAEVLANAFWNLISTEAQRERQAKQTPIGFSNFDIDDDGFIFTVTDSQEINTDLVKKLNPRGDNILDSLGVSDMTFGDMPPTYYSIYSKRSSLTDIDIGPSGELNILDFQHGRIFQYDKECWLMFIMGGTGDQLGLFRSAAAIESYDNKLYVLDSRKNNITIFTRTVFGEIVTEAANLYNDGLYEESLEPWRNVLKYDGNYRRAYIGIGNALYNKYEYKEAMEYFEISISRGRYNRAFEGYRDQWLKENYMTCIIVIVALIILLTVYKQLRKRGKIVYPWEKRRKGGV
ncbi:MAG: NHL repeat-containing protein [Oscillospiraceae bacterium]|nr:NHL repeat-containing protein [Oscillospiraceae bacterium]